MFVSLVFASALTLVPSQAPFTLGTPRLTYGELGARRADDKFLPGDIVFIAFDINGIQADEGGKVKYSMAMEVSDATGKAIFKQPAAVREDFLPLGGGKLPARAYVSISPTQGPGTYTCKVSVSTGDAAAQTVEQKFQVTEKGFGLVGVYTSVDSKGQLPSAMTGVTGQSMVVHFAAVNFGRDAKKQPNLEVEMNITAKDGTPTMAKPTTVSITTDVKEDELFVPLSFMLPLTRVGDFTVELKATDKTVGKAMTVRFPIKVYPSE